MNTPQSEPVGEQQPSEAELRAALEEQLRHMTPADVIVQTAVTLINLAGRRLGLAPGSESERDLGQVRDAIDAVRALMPMLERGEGAETIDPLREALSALQLEYAKLATSAAPASGGEPGSAPPASGDEPEQPAPKSGPGPAQSSGRLWVPGSPR
jgi:hypothetical protein